jgi:hypothetical protein
VRKRDSSLPPQRTQTPHALRTTGSLRMTHPGCLLTKSEFQYPVYTLGAGWKGQEIRR